MLGLRLAALTTDRLGDERSSDPGVRPERPMLAAAHMIHGGADALLVDDAPSPLAHAARRRSRHGGAQDVQPRTLCICVEDFGMHPGINGAALRLAGMARAHAIGCRVGGGHWSAWRHALRRLDAHGIDLGLQLDLTEHPLLPRTDHSLGQLVARTYGRWISRANLHVEIRAQLGKFEAPPSAMSRWDWRSNRYVNQRALTASLRIPPATPGEIE